MKVFLSDRQIVENGDEGRRTGEGREGERGREREVREAGGERY